MANGRGFGVLVALPMLSNHRVGSVWGLHALPQLTSPPPYIPSCLPSPLILWNSKSNNASSEDTRKWDSPWYTSGRRAVGQPSPSITTMSYQQTHNPAGVHHALPALPRHLSVTHQHSPSVRSVEKTPARRMVTKHADNLLNANTTTRNTTHAPPLTRTACHLAVVSSAISSRL